MKKINILFYGNCQIKGIRKTLNISDNIYEITIIECYKGVLKKEDFTQIISKSDIIITQPLRDSYRDVDYLSTSYVLKHKSPHCKVIVLDSCYFRFYTFDTTAKSYNNKGIKLPSNYHHNEMMKCYTDGRSIDFFINNVVNNINFKTSEKLETCADNSLNELRVRYEANKKKYSSATNLHIITIHDYIKQNYKDRLLFYTPNHPTKHVLQYICEEIASSLQMQTDINYDIDPLDRPRCIIYKCVEKNVNFNIDEHPPHIQGITDAKRITQLYYKAYKEIGLV